MNAWSAASSSASILLMPRCESPSPSCLATAVRLSFRVAVIGTFVGEVAQQLGEIAARVGATIVGKRRRGRVAGIRGVVGIAKARAGAVADDRGEAAARELRMPVRAAALREV